MRDEKRKEKKIRNEREREKRTRVIYIRSASHQK